MNVAQRLTCDELGDLLQQHLGGTALEGLAKNRSYIIDAEGYVARETVSSLCRALLHAAHTYIIAEDIKRQRRVMRERIEKGVHRIAETVDMYLPGLLEWVGNVCLPSATEPVPQDQEPDPEKFLYVVGQIRNTIAAIQPFGTQLQTSPSN